MCDRCGAGFTFFGLAEPQAALLDAYTNAVRAGWTPNSTVAADDFLRTAIENAETFLSERADAIDRSRSEAGEQVPRRIRLVRWLWDGEFCGEARFVYDAGEEASVSTSIVPWKDALRYRERAMRHLLLEARDLGVPAAALDRAFNSAR